ncbi:maleylpyruvate isomerase N-terminal domain-containing protein, partial [Streptomyces sp. NPDC005407]|uniref:maleylpyruvate isomerase N-terminal domain-containing protein n=1 Tax=Streptomyces sp. NPDC005407 TaxID=3155340 RepID=UPI0033A71788
MPTNMQGLTNPVDFDRLRRLHAQAVRDSVTLVRRVAPADLPLPTPCEAWTLADLLAHMTAQHHGFAAVAGAADVAEVVVEAVAEAGDTARVVADVGRAR